jgi:spore germination protein YaaH
VAETAASAPKTAYQALPDRYWEYSFAELGQHMNQVVYLDEAASEPAGAVASAPKTRYQVLPDRFWEYSFSELGQYMNQIIFLDEQ